MREDHDQPEEFDRQLLDEFWETRTRYIQAKRETQRKKLELLKNSAADVYPLDEATGYLSACIEDDEFAQNRWRTSVISRRTWAQILNWLKELREWRLLAAVEDEGSPK